MTAHGERPRLAVVGAGPAGLAAALAAARQGLTVTLVDAAPQAGGQFHRQPAEGLGARRARALHHRWSTWERLRDGLARHVAAGRITHLPDHHVWTVEREKDTDPDLDPDGTFVVHALRGPAQEEPATVRADGLVIATGGYETVLPFPGWTLPGVVTAGGAQAMLKGGLVLPGRTAVVAGTGPLLMPVAAGLAAAGARVAALVEAAGARDVARSAPALAAHPGKLAEGARYAAELLRHRVPVRSRHTVVAAHGTDRLDAVTVAALDPDGRVRTGTGHRVPCDTLAVGHGMLPHTDLAETLGCAVDGRRVRVDDEQRTDVPGVWAAGETTGIGGADLALAEGRIAGLSAAARLDSRTPDRSSWRSAAAARSRLRRFASAVDAVYRPPAHWTDQVTDDTVVCRCEEVPAADVRAAVGELGAGDLRTVKLLTRAGMGWCQGRMCGPAVAGLLGCELPVSRRPFARPLPLGVLAGATEDPTEDPQPVRPEEENA
ncbi:FAD/NAD(P)-dependent oxidoreductase [Streptomyces longispororuber]|uniref:FAD/NAD(P)-dependent oxidoreductase n=1 Tax=Streptomyces longispororuber TaxID=68230 RepID=UPI00210C7959|nr:NAD(P)/FAD-dependent oxidoreductase [Streptomyces longispororuber]MCQ4207514.1 NAD(P)/FAD-dependent oxidoreductase [Streptomyces longispororuber]